MKRLIYSFLFLIAILSGCATDSEIQNIGINSRINIVMKEEILTGGRNFIFECKTDSNFSCSNYGISYQYQKNGKVFAINFSHIIEPEDCENSPGKATARIEFGSLAPGNYTLQLLANEDVINTTLEISPAEFKVEDSVRTWIKITNPQLYRIPENTIWGYIGFSNEPFAVQQVQPFIDSLKIIGAQEINLNNGNYTYFTVDSDNVVLTTEPETENVIFFAYDFTGDISELRDLIKSYGKNSPLSIAVFTTDGDAFYTWQLATEP